MYNIYHISYMNICGLVGSKGDREGATGRRFECYGALII